MTGATPHPGGKLPAAAASALLTLRLRAALQEAETAEAAEAQFAASHSQRGGEPAEDPVAERRLAHAAELRGAREESALRLEQAQHEADRIKSEAQLRAEELVRLRHVPPPVFAEPADAIPLLLASPKFEPVLREGPDPWVEFARPEPDTPVEVVMAVEAAVAQSIVVDRWADASATRVDEGSSAVVTVDAEAFARVFATVLATVLDERFVAWRSEMIGPLAPQALDSRMAPRNQPALRRAFHLDTVLAALAAAIVLMLLFAWLG